MNGVTKYKHDGKEGADRRMVISENNDGPKRRRMRKRQAGKGKNDSQGRYEIRGYQKGAGPCTKPSTHYGIMKSFIKCGEIPEAGLTQGGQARFPKAQ